MSGVPSLAATAGPAAATAAPAPVPRDVALFNLLVETRAKLWNECPRYGPAGLKIRRALIAFFALIIVTFVLEAATVRRT